jgi:hypothetical protein
MENNDPELLESLAIRLGGMKNYFGGTELLLRGFSPIYSINSDNFKGEY